MKATQTEPDRDSRCSVHLRADLRARLGTMVCAGYPDETCGLLLGVRTGDAVEVQARTVSCFRAGKILQARLNPEMTMSSSLT